MKIVTASQMQALDRRTIEQARVPSLTLMERAGTGAVDMINARWGKLRGKRVAIICGKGNNGGDGWVIARRLHTTGTRVAAYTVAPPESFSADARAMYQKFIRKAGARAVRTVPPRADLLAQISEAALLVDAVFGTGLSAPVEGALREAIEAMNEAAAGGRVPVVAVDIPSGLHADTGAVMGAAVQATATVTFGLPKLGLYVGAGVDHAGSIDIIDIGIPAEYVADVATPYALISDADLASTLRPRRAASHKGTYGHAAIIAGSPGKTGAAALAGLAALRSGAGLVTVATPAGAHAALESKLLEVMSMPMPDTEAHTLSSKALEPLLEVAESRSAAALGPGLTTHPETVRLLQDLIPRLEVPFVLDADALNALAGRTELLERCKTMPILTPHPGEMARLLGTTPQKVNADRVGSAARFAAAHRALVVLKGARTLVAHPDGRVAICPTGNPGMATAGTGDVLTGVMVGLLAQGLSGWEAARAAVYLHGLAGDLAASEVGPVGMTAGDLSRHLPAARRHAMEKPS
jgi:ADP-dependent NAD(P)H-hydrate dehydratase / NAD(P)H-hydrate epimerase